MGKTLKELPVAIIDRPFVTAENEENALVNLGFTSLQARVYLVLAHNGPSKVTAISKLSNIHRTHLYEVLRALEECGFVEKQLVSSLYSATSLEEIVVRLVNHRKEAIVKLESELSAITKSLPQHSPEQKHKKKELVLSPNKTSNFAKGYKYLDSAKVQIEQMHTWKRFIQLWEIFEDQLSEKLNSGVKVRQIIEIPPDLNQAQRYLNKEVFRSPYFELRFVTRTGGNVTIIDNEKVFMSTSKDKENLGETPLLFSNYEGLLGLMRNYYDYCWQYGFRLEAGKLISRDR